MSEEDINFLISIQDLEQPEFDNAYLERENERLRSQLQQKENKEKEIREYLDKYSRYCSNKEYFSTRNPITDLKIILDKEMN